MLGGSTIRQKTDPQEELTQASGSFGLELAFSTIVSSHSQPDCHDSCLLASAITLGRDKGLRKKNIKLGVVVVKDKVV